MRHRVLIYFSELCTGKTGPLTICDLHIPKNGVAAHLNKYIIHLRLEPFIVYYYLH